MKITSWNVNGLRSVINKGALDWVGKNQPDVICLQEIKARPEQIDNSTIQWIDSYYTSWHPAERPGYSGVVTFSKEKPEDVNIGIGDMRFDVEGRVVKKSEKQEGDDMPYEIEERDGEYCVIKIEDGESAGCHETREEAEAQLTALRINVEEGEAIIWKNNK